MRSLKAIFAGSLFIIVVILCLQLAYIFLAVAYNALAKDYLFLNDISASFRYIIGIPVFLLTMFFGGFITAEVAGSKNRRDMWLHCGIVGLITTGGMIWSALENTSLTITGGVIIILAVAATVAGGRYWQGALRSN